jgi:hypothetical protein
MPIIDETKQSLERFKKYADQLTDLCREQGIKGWRAPLQLVTAYRDDSEFRSEWNSIFERAANADGGKIGFGAALGILGLVLGGVGLAGAWGAIGVPLVAILVPFGYLVGNELDHYRNKAAIEICPNPSPRSEGPDEFSLPPTILARTEPPFADVVTMIRVLAECYADVATMRQQFDSVRVRTVALEEKLDRTQNVINGLVAARMESRCEAVEASLKEVKSRLLEFQGKSQAAQQVSENNLATMQIEVRVLKSTVRWMRVALILVGLASGMGIVSVWLILR